MRAVLRCAMLAIVAIGLSACASQPTSRPTTPVSPDPSALTQWEARGRIGVSGVEGGGSGSFTWLQEDDRADINIRGPAGIGSLRLKVQGSEDDPALTLQTGNGETLESQAAWDELEARLGATVPAGHLRFWMLGLAAPGEHEWQSAAEGQKTLLQDGWQIVYQKYSNDFGAPVPVRMNASSGATRVRIVVDRWQLGQ